MTNDQLDVRWKQRLSNYKKALRQLDEFMAQSELNKLEEQGLIKAFEYTYELAWNTLKDYLEYQGETDIAGSRDAFRKSYAAGLISNGEAWMDMLQSRNKTSHTYNEETAADIVASIKNDYYGLFCELKDEMENRARMGE
jgi:nucleotidyltransferase substrate binding protein (TIGR01987 family)